MRIALKIEYDGSRFHGWQAQPGLCTIQQSVETALSKVADCEIKIACAGRTDTGVHATHQIVHFDCHKKRNLQAWIHGSNNFLPKEICVKSAQEMPEDFHARYSALARQYSYFIYNGSIRPAILRSHVTWQYHSLNQAMMHEASQYLLGEHDFTSFRSIECQSSTPMRKIQHIEVSRRNDLVAIHITANAFLHHMVRNIAGVLIKVGLGKKQPEWVEEVLIAKNRRLGAETAPPYGLYLVGVTYPQRFNLSSYQYPLFF